MDWSAAIDVATPFPADLKPVLDYPKNLALLLVSAAVVSCATGPASTGTANTEPSPAVAAPLSAKAPVPDVSPAIPSYPAANSPKNGPPAFASSGKKISLAQGYIIGADLSAVPAEEARGVQYMDQGKVRDILEIMKAHGFNYVRLRIFVDPTDRASNGYSPQGYCGLEQTIIFGKRIKAAGMGLLLDFHYSDSWADPGKQTKPHAWWDLDLPDLVRAVHDYSKDVITKMKAAGVEPDMMQPGNEITPGMLLNTLPASGRGGAARQISTQPEGSTKNWNYLAALLKAGIAGVKEVNPNIVIMLHIDKGGNNKVTHAWVDGALSHGVEFDVLGESCYSNTAWQGPITKQVANFTELVKSYPNLYFINDEYGGSMRNADNDQVDNNNPNLVVLQKPEWSTDGLDWSKRWANDMMFEIPNEKGLGAFIWEPTQNINQESLFTNVRDPATGQNHPTANQEMYLYDKMAKSYASRMKQPGEKKTP